MDLTLIFIGLMLVVTGAVFFGYPIGLMIGKNGWGESFEASPEQTKWEVEDEYV